MAYYGSSERGVAQVDAHHSLDWHLEQPYPYLVVPDPDGGYVIRFPDLPGCMTQVESADEIAPMADEIRILWIETELDRD